MRRINLLIPLLLFTVAAFAQVTSTTQTTRTTRSSPTTHQQTTTTERTTTTTNGVAHTVEGCVMREATDFFLVPSSGSPIRLNGSTGVDLSTQEGHLVRVRGTEIAGSDTRHEPVQSGDSGRDLHRLATRHMDVSRVTPVANSCPVNWNPQASPRH